MISRAFFISLLVLLLAPQAHADETLIHEIDALRNSLNRQDPTRQTLTLRLADLLFDEALQASKSADPSPMDVEKANGYRRRAVALYREVLVGNGPVAPVSGSLRTKVQFQLARLYSDLDESTEANVLWKSLVDQVELRDLRREAALRLAEYYEKSATGVELADKYYRLAIDLCSGGDLCSYGHYRLAWLYKNQGKLPRGVAEMKRALFDSKGQVREEAARDLLVFMGGESTDGEAQLQYVEDLAARVNRPQLLQQLSEAFYSAGNKAAGTRVLEYVNSKRPQLLSQMRLLEEFYGMRSWDKFRALLDQVSSGTIAPVAEQKDQVESEKILRRLTVQLDGERISQPQYDRDFKATTLLYLKLFPGDHRMKMIEGWLAAEKDPNAKAAQLKIWIKQKQPAPAPAEVVKLREFRADVAIKNKMYPVIVEEMAALAALSSGTKARDYRFLQAAALVDSKQSAVALPIAQDLAKLTPPDGAAVKSQHLAMAILAQQKNYAALIQQGSSWIHSNKTSDNAKSGKLTKDVHEMEDMVSQASFEQAVQRGRTKAALETFEQFCLAKHFLPKSCENARVLATQLKDQPTLLTILAAEGKKDELAQEDEASGHFASAAELLEPKLVKGTPVAEYLHVAVLYELSGKSAHRDHVLSSLMNVLRSQKAMGETEDAVYITLRDANLLTQPTAVTLPWNRAHRIRIAEKLEEKGLGNAGTRELIMTSGDDFGPRWGELALEDLRRLDENQRRIDIYGKRSAKKFERRVAGLKKLSESTDGYLKRARASTRAEISELAQKSYADFAKTIQNSPVPADLAPEQLQAVKASLDQMASPFLERAKAYETIVTDSRAKDASEKKVANPPGGAPTVVQAGIAGTTQSASTVEEAAMLERALQTLHANPSDHSSLITIKQYYEKRGQVRLASYFEGRLEQAPKEGKAE